MSNGSTSGGPAQNLEIVLENPGVVGRFNLVELQNAVAAYVQNSGGAAESQRVNILLSGPINVSLAVLSPIEIVSAQQGGVGSFLLADLQNALAAFMQNSGQGAVPNVHVVIHILLADDSGTGWGDPK